ncbi:hypothetical protein BGZ76_006202 [Entomortierella beljakovae]|nr:hypothetical protein BGZ76_006202 [Entomortierella beljakovae]
MGRNWHASARNVGHAPASSSRMAGTLFYSVPTIDNDTVDTDDENQYNETLHMHESFMPEYDSDDDSESSTHSPPMSLFLDRQPQPEVPPLTPAAIYLDVPPPVSTKSKSGGSLGDQLLEPTSIIGGPVGWTSISYKRNFKDPFFAVLYIVSLAAYFILGIVLLFTTSKGKYIMNVDIGDSDFSSSWDHMAGYFKIIYKSPRRDDGKRDPQDTGLTALSMLPLGIGSLFLSVIYFRRQYIARTTAIIELACEILKDNPDMFFVSFGLMVVHVVFTAIWLLFFSRVFLIGHVETSTDSKKWVLEDNFYPIAGFLLFIYMWTSAVLSNIQRHEPFAYHSSKITEPALINATTTSFGSVCLGALFIAIVQFTALLLRSSAKKLKKSSFPLFVLIATCFSVIQGLVENFNNYTLIYVGITGESLFSAARSASKIFHRNLLWGLISDFLTKIILFIYSTLLSLLTGFAAYVFATHTLNSPYGYVIGILSGIIPFYVTRFFTHIMAITVDATFLCYAIDLDTNTCHSNKAHSAFGMPH